MRYFFETIRWFVFSAILFAGAMSVWALAPNEAEMNRKNDWLTTHFLQDSAAYPFSFVWDKEQSSAFLATWPRRLESEPLEDGRTRHTLTFCQPNGPLEVECRLIDYADFPTVEWTLVFRNVSQEPTPILENIRVLESFFPAVVTDGCFVPTLHHAVGSPCRVDDYRPLATPLYPRFSCRFSPGDGRSSNLHLPYFNLQSGPNFGSIFAIGWGGEWEARFEERPNADERVLGDGDGTFVAFGQERTHFRLLPGEEVSSPSVVYQAWERSNGIDAQNVWRAWMIAHSLPKIDGKIDPGHVWGSTDRCGEEPFVGGAKPRIAAIDQMIAENAVPDYVHIDAGWYPCGGPWWNIGTWEVDKTRYPNGIREVFEHAKQAGAGSVLWFEPERVAPGSWLATQHPEWCSDGESGGLFKYHVPEAFDWMLERIDQIITDEQVDFYRQDFNMSPLDHWRRQDTPDRVGITEIRHIEAYYRLWDELKKRHPKIKLDACASGGRRNDYLTMRRAVPLCRSDYGGGSLGRQVQSYGAHLWIPFTGSGYGMTPSDPNYTYHFRSWAFAPYSGFAFTNNPGDSYDLYRKNREIWREYVLPYYAADYYPLTDCTLDERDWIGWQYHDNAQNAGVVQMFRRPESPDAARSIALFGLDPAKRYVVTNVDTEKSAEYSGETLLNEGLPIEFDHAPQALVLSYRAQ